LIRMAEAWVGGMRRVTLSFSLCMREREGERETDTQPDIRRKSERKREKVVLSRG